MDIVAEIIYNDKLIGNNKRYKHRRSKALTDEYVAFKHHLGYLAKAQSNKNDAVGRYRIEIEYRSRHDTDALMKAIFDAFEGIIYKNDRQIDEHEVKRNKCLPHKLKITVLKI